jgi:hypothetical protein
MSHSEEQPHGNPFRSSVGIAEKAGKSYVWPMKFLQDASKNFGDAYLFTFF